MSKLAQEYNQRWVLIIDSWKKANSRSSVLTPRCWCRLRRIANLWETKQFPDFRVVAQPFLEHGQPQKHFFSALGKENLLLVPNRLLATCDSNLTAGICTIGVEDCFHPNLYTEHLWTIGLWNKCVACSVLREDMAEQYG